MVSVPSAFEANALPEAASNPAPSTPAPNRGRCDYLAGLIVGDRHHAAAGSAEQPMVGGVDGYRDRLLARSVDQSRATVAAFASISTTSLVSVRFAYTLPSPVDAPYSGLPPSGMFVISVPARGSTTVEECASPLNVKTRFDALS